MTRDEPIIIIPSAGGPRAAVDPERYERDRQTLVANGMPDIRINADGRPRS